MAQWVKNLNAGILVMVQWKWIWLGTMKLQVRSLVLLSGLRIWRFGELWRRSQTRLGSCVAVVKASSYSSDSTPSLETSIRRGCSSKKQQQKSECRFNPWALLSGLRIQCCHELCRAAAALIQLLAGTSMCHHKKIPNKQKNPKHTHTQNLVTFSGKICSIYMGMWHFYFWMLIIFPNMLYL